MIDEELYQQAADELNTDRRRAHIWARACALASDDHDEARYLYTNLRVEELIAEREAGKGSSAADDPSVLEADEHDATLALEPVSFEKDDTGAAKFGFLDEDESTLGESEDVAASYSAPSGVDSAKNDSNDVFELVPSGLDDTDSQLDETSELDTTAVLDLDADDLAEFQASVPAEDYETFDAQAAASLGETEEALQLDETILPARAAEDALIEEATAQLDAPIEESQSVSGLTDIEGLDDDNAAPRDQTSQADDDLNELLSDGYPAGKDVDSQGSSQSSDEAEEALTADFSDASGTHAVVLDDELDWLDDEVVPGEPDAVVMDNALKPYKPAALNHDDTDRLTQELERQADEMPGQHSDVVAHEVPEKPDISPAATPDNADHASQNVDDADSKDSARESQVAAAAVTAAAAGAAATATATAATTYQTEPVAGRTDSTPAAHSHRARDFPLDLSEDTIGTPFSVYRRDSRVQAVKDGVSWSALLMTIPFLIYRQLFGTAIVYTLMAVILLAGLLIMGLAWFDAGTAATPLVKGATIGFAVLAAIGLLYIPFRYGNTWRGDKLESRGFELVAWVRAKNSGKAIAQARRAAALD